MDRIGRYEIIRELGAGGMGRVFLARDTDLGREVALKVIRQDASWNEKDWQELLRRFDTEARAAAGLRHPNIVSIYERGVVENQSYIAMEYVPGETLDARIQRDGVLAPDLAIRILKQLADALDYSHSKSVIHRDIKPSNILIQPDGKAMVMDFGIAKAKLSDLTTRMSSMLVGSPMYMAPERLQFKPAVAASDQWAMAVTAYKMLTGKPPFLSGPEGPFTEILEGRVIDARQHNPELRQPAWEVMRRALSKEPADRFGCCMDFVRALDHALGTPKAAPKIAAAAVAPVAAAPPVAEPLPPAIEVEPAVQPVVASPAPAPPVQPATITPQVVSPQQPQQWMPPPPPPPRPKRSFFAQAQAFLAFPAIAAALYGIYWILTYNPPTPPPPPKIEFFRVAESFQSERGGAWTVRVEWSTLNGSKVTLEPEPGPVEASGQKTYEITATKTITLKVNNKSGEAAHEITLDAAASPSSP